MIVQDFADNRYRLYPNPSSTQTKVYDTRGALINVIGSGKEPSNKLIS